MFERMLEVVNECLEDSELSSEQADVNLTEVGLDSIAFIRMIVSLEDNFGCEIPDFKLHIEEMNTLNKIFEVINISGGN